MLAVPGVNLAVHTDRPILSTGAYLDFKRHVDYLLQQGHHGQARLLWLSAVEVLRAPFAQPPLPVADSGEIPHLQFEPCIDAPCARCDGSLGFKFPFIGTWCRRAVLVQEGATASEAWAAYQTQNPPKIPGGAKECRRQTACWICTTNASDLGGGGGLVPRSGSHPQQRFHILSISSSAPPASPDKRNCKQAVSPAT